MDFRPCDIDFNALKANTGEFTTNCYSITFRNEGASLATLEKGDERFDIHPGTETTFTAPPGCIYTTAFKSITFVGGTGRLVIVKEHYV